MYKADSEVLEFYKDKFNLLLAVWEAKNPGRYRHEILIEKDIMYVSTILTSDGKELKDLKDEIETLKVQIDILENPPPP